MSVVLESVINFVCSTYNLEPFFGRQTIKFCTLFFFSKLLWEEQLGSTSQRIYIMTDEWFHCSILKCIKRSITFLMTANWMLRIIFRTNYIQLSLFLHSVLCFVTMRCPCVNTKLHSMYRVHRVWGAGWETEHFFLGRPPSSLSLSHAFIFTSFFVFLPFPYSLF